MAVKIGSARIDENGKAHGGKAGDQTGKEVSTQNWYRYKKNGKYVDWVVLRFKNPEYAERNAVAMEHACANNDIGYNQYKRDSLLKNVAPFGYDPAKTTKPVETDCSALERDTIAYAVGRDIAGEYMRGRRFDTAHMIDILTDTGLFEVLIGEKYGQSSDYLKRGDILCTAVQAHTVTVLSNGAKVANEDPDELRKGDKGDAVTAMQKMLMRWKSDCLPRYGADGEFGTETQNAIKAFQGECSIKLTGTYNAETRNALKERCGRRIIVTCDSLNVRDMPGTHGAVLRVIHRGDVYPLIETAENGWHHISIGWISGKYSKEVEE